MMKRSIRNSQKKTPQKTPFRPVIFMCLDWFRKSEHLFRESYKHSSGQLQEHTYSSLAPSKVPINPVQQFCKALKNIQKCFIRLRPMLALCPVFVSD